MVAKTAWRLSGGDGTSIVDGLGGDPDRGRRRRGRGGPPDRVLPSPSCPPLDGLLPGRARDGGTVPTASASRGVVDPDDGHKLVDSPRPRDSNCTGGSERQS